MKIVTECGFGACPALVFDDDDEYVAIIGAGEPLSDEVRAMVGQGESIVRIPRSLLEKWKHES